MFMNRLLCLLAAAAVFSAVAGRAPAQTAPPLPALQLDPAGTTVSGLSSGAYLAGQLHVAHSTSIAGAGLIAGGPYYCAEGQVVTALNRCMQTLLGRPDPAALLARASTLAETGGIDPLEGLADDRVYLFSGGADETVTRPVMDAARDFYLQAGVAAAHIAYVTEIPAGHGFIVEEAELACGLSESPFINDCDYDQAGAVLRQLYGDLAPPAGPDADSLRRFDQAEFLADPESHGMAAEGFVYVPAACAAGESCRLHIALAGCRQTPAHIGDLFARTAGYNRWAESNRIVVLYPQSSVSPGNPRGCWDWWGYDDATYHTKRGRQLAAIAEMAARLGVPFAAGPTPAFCRSHPAWNANHWFAGRAELCGWGGLCAVGTGDFIGFVYGASTLYESPEGTFSMAPCTP